MKTSARNCSRGTVLKIGNGAVNDEIEFVLDDVGSTRMTAVITSASTKTLGLASGSKILALIKASWVILLTEAEGIKFSARNQLSGAVVAVEDGAVNGEVRVRLNGGEPLTAIVTMESVRNLGLKAGSRVTALIKASHVILGVEA